MDGPFFAPRKPNTVLAVAGPTASGKSSLAMELARTFDGEIVSCDSMQIYRGMDIGTAKDTLQEREEIPHHLIDLVDPDTPFSCAQYADAARAAISDILDRGKLPVLCGGTGLYLESAVYDRTLESPGESPELREMLGSRSDEENYAELVRVDPISAEAIHPNNRKRVIRALEIYRLSGIPKSQWDLSSRQHSSGFDCRILVLTASDREVLYRRIDQRVDRMMEAGLLNEVKSLNLSPDTTAGQAIGYKELSDYIRGACSLDEAVDRIKRASRNYAKRQITWFKRYPDACVLDICRKDADKNIVKLLLKSLI